MAGERCSLWMPGVWCCARAGTGTSHPPSPRFVPGTVQLPTRRPWTASWSYGKSSRLAFERLQGRLQRRGAGAARLAEQWPAHFVAFDLLRLAGTDTTRWPYAGAAGLLWNASLPNGTSPRRGRCARRSPRWPGDSRNCGQSPENGQGYLSPHLVRRSTEWGVSASVAPAAYHAAGTLAATGPG